MTAAAIQAESQGNALGDLFRFHLKLRRRRGLVVVEIDNPITKTTTMIAAELATTTSISCRSEIKAIYGKDFTDFRSS